MINKSSKYPNHGIANDLKKFDLIDQKRRQQRPLINNALLTADGKKPGHQRSLTHTVGLENKVTKNLRKIQELNDSELIIQKNKQAPFVIHTQDEDEEISPSKSSK